MIRNLHSFGATKKYNSLRMTTEFSSRRDIHLFLQKQKLGRVADLYMSQPVDEISKENLHSGAPFFWYLCFPP